MDKNRTDDFDRAAPPRPAVDLDAVMEHIRVELNQEPAAAVQTKSAVETSVADEYPTLTTDEIMARVRAEVARRRSSGSVRAAGAALGTGADASLGTTRRENLPRWEPAAPRLPQQQEYVLNDFMRFDDADFIDVAYHCLLRRSPDAKGRQEYLDALRSGAISKVEILGQIRFSAEGRQQGVHVDGLLLPYKLHSWRHVRVLGWFLGMAMALWRLPRLAWRLQGMEASAARESQQAGRLLAQVADEVDRHFADVGGVIHALREELSQLVRSRAESLRVVAAQVRALQAALESVNDAMRAKDEQQEARGAVIEALETSASALRVQVGAISASLQSLENQHASQFQAVQERFARHDAQVVELANALDGRDAERGRQIQAVGDRQAIQDAALARLGEQSRSDQRSLRAMLERLTVFLDAAVRRQKELGAREGEKAPPALEAQYASFEQTFRGGREQIKQRAARYLGTLAAAGISPGGDELILDLGSGRGEWLEVLAEYGYRGRGIDLNRGMLQESEVRGHDVVEADALGYLRVQDDDSVAAITSMHLVEHISHEVLIQLLDEALRVLRPGGVLILETPNPENVLVGSCTFYMDPTHLNPIPPPLLQWVVQARGFEQVNIERLSEHRGSFDLTPVPDNLPGAEQINQMIAWFTAPPDYAIVARASIKLPSQLLP